jgi:hypothetical protein
MKITRSQLKRIIKEEIWRGKNIANPSMEETDKSSELINEVPTTMDDKTSGMWDEFTTSADKLQVMQGDQLTADGITKAWLDSISDTDEADDEGAAALIIEKLKFTASLETVKAAFIEVVS